ncbi:MAG: ABC transporter permease [Ruminococcus sp.]|jgi:ABC-2 type transport system permease protein|nr:ABC transporter permease [Ruminococcus sp.]
MFSIYKKDLTSYFYSPFAYIICGLFLLIFSLSFIGSLSNMNSDTYVFSYSSVFYNNFFFFIFLIPALTMKTFADERKSGTEVLLVTSPLSSFQVVLGKFFSVMTIWMLMCGLSLVYPVLTAMNGTVYVSSFICAFIGFFAWGMICIAIGMLISSFTENTVVAAVISEAVMLLILMLDQLSTSLKYTNMKWISDILIWFSNQERFTSFQNGIFRLSDLIFYVTMTAVFLGFTVISLEKRRWSRK